MTLVQYPYDNKVEYATKSWPAFPTATSQKLIKICRKLTEALALVGDTINEDLGADDLAKGHEHLGEFSIAKLLRQVVDEEITTFWSLGKR